MNTSNSLTQQESLSFAKGCAFIKKLQEYQDERLDLLFIHFYHASPPPSTSYAVPFHGSSTASINGLNHHYLIHPYFNNHGHNSPTFLKAQRPSSTFSRGYATTTPSSEAQSLSNTRNANQETHSTQRRYSSPADTYAQCSGSDGPAEFANAETSQCDGGEAG